MHSIHGLEKIVMNHHVNYNKKYMQSKMNNVNNRVNQSQRLNWYGFIHLFFSKQTKSIKQMKNF